MTLQDGRRDDGPLPAPAECDNRLSPIQFAHPVLQFAQENMTGALHVSLFELRLFSDIEQRKRFAVFNSLRQGVGMDSADAFIF